MSNTRAQQISSIATFLSLFSDNTNKWSDATDEIRDLSRTAKEYINEFDLNLCDDDIEKGLGRQPLDFTILKTPSEWNTFGKKHIKTSLAIMTDSTLTRFYNDHLNMFE